MKATKRVIAGLLASAMSFAGAAYAADATGWKSPLLAEKAFTSQAKPAPTAPRPAAPAVGELTSSLVKLAATVAFPHSAGGCPDHVGSIGRTANEASSQSTIACEKPWGSN
jgi:hypothetical protein